MRILLEGIEPVSTNDMYMPVASRGKGGRYYGRFVATDALRNYKESISKAIHKALGHDAKLDESGLYRLKVEVSYPRSEFMTQSEELKQRDASNVIKALEDGIYEALKVNDKQNLEVEVKKFYNDDGTHIIYAEIEKIDKTTDSLNRGLSYYENLVK